MISQGYPLFAVDGEGGVHAVVAWQPAVVNVGSGDMSTLHPVVVDASGHLDPMPMVWGASPLRYFTTIEEAMLHAVGGPDFPGPR